MTSSAIPDSDLKELQRLIKCRKDGSVRVGDGQSVFDARQLRLNTDSGLVQERGRILR